MVETSSRSNIRVKRLSRYLFLDYSDVHLDRRDLYVMPSVLITFLFIFENF